MKEYESLTYVNSRNESITFGVGSKYHVNVIRDASGQSNLSDTIYSTSSMGQHGDTFQGVRIEPRDITINGKILSNDRSVEIDLRQRLLKILNPELNGTLYYQYGNFRRMIGAKVDGSPTFSHPDLSEVFDITFKCLNPFWLETSTHREDIASWIPAWYFPTVIMRDDPNSMIYGHRETNVIVDVINAGHVATGMTIQFRAIGELTNPYLLNVNTREFIKVNYTMIAGDVIEINTGYGSKSITLFRNGTETNIYRYMDVDSTFLQLDIGDNVFRYDADTGMTSLECTILFDQKYLGV